MPAGTLSQVVSKSQSESRPAHERQVTSRREWRRGLPGINSSLLNAINDNDPPLGRPIPTKRWMRLEPLLEWTYQVQKAHLILREAMDWIRWGMDHAGYITAPGDLRKLHYDAALVHEAVLGLGTEAAALIIPAAVTGMWPEQLAEEDCRFYPEEPRDRHDDIGWYTREDGSRAEYVKRTAEIVSIPQDEWERVGRKKMRRAKITSWEKVPVIYCPGHWEPEPEFVQAENRRYASWQGYSAALMPVLRAAPFKDHAMAVAAANDNVPDPVAANDNEPLGCEIAA